MPDLHKNFAYSTVATAPSPATSGTSLVVAAGDGAKFPAVPFNATVWATGANALTTNAEIVRVTAIATDTLTITRAQEGSTARTVVVGDQIAATVTNRTLTDIEQWIPAAAPSLAGHNAVYDGSAMQAKVIRAAYDAGVPLTNVTSLTTVLAATMTIKAPFVVGDLFRLTVGGKWANTAGGTIGATAAVLIGGVSSGTVTYSTFGSNANPHPWWLDVVFTILVVNASGTVSIAGKSDIGGAGAGGWVQQQALGNLNGLQNAVTVDTTADLTVDVQATTGAAASAVLTPGFIELTRMPKL